MISRTARTKAAFNKQALLTCRLYLYLRKKAVKCYIWSRALYGVNFGHFEKWVRNTWRV
jgi:hypothetical protein